MAGPPRHVPFLAGIRFFPDTCNYFGNRLSLCRTEGRSYSHDYDHSGAMTYDGKNQVTLTRSILGQPYQLEDARGSYVEFSYLADGTKRYMVADASQHEPVFSNPYIDYGARYYDPTVARWHRPDPMADKYPDTSPYAFCANDPVNFVDLNGLDTVYVLRVSDNPVGHIAILVPDEGQYVLYSKNGRKFSTHDDDQGLSVGETAQSFLDNTTKNTVTHGQQADDNTFPYYDAAYAIEVSPEQVESIAQTMKEQTENSEDYNLFSNNCTTSVSLALEKAGVKTMPEGPINHIDSHHEGLMFTLVVFYHQLKLANPRIKELTPTKK